MTDDQHAIELAISLVTAKMLGGESPEFPGAPQSAAVMVGIGNALRDDAEPPFFALRLIDRLADIAVFLASVSVAETDSTPDEVARRIVEAFDF